MAAVMMMVVLAWQQVVFDPATVFNALVGDNARRPERRPCRDGGADLH